MKLVGNFAYSLDMTSYDLIHNYPEPLPDIRTRYRYETALKDGKFSSGLQVTVFRIGPDGDTKVAEYSRNYSMMQTFEPFAQRQGDEWHDYALISDDYTRLAVLDLETGKIVAVEPYPVADKELAEISNDGIVEGQELPQLGFCPAEFYVPNWWENYNESFFSRNLSGTLFPKSGREAALIKTFQEMAMYEGQWGVYSGCVWGDDNSLKIRFVDLSRVKEGIVTTDDRFGYFQLPSQGDLRSSIEIIPSRNMVRISTPISFNLTKNKAIGKDSTVECINWEN